MQAKLVGQQKKRWLLVNLQDSREFASQILNRDVWSNYNVKELVQRNFVFMQVCIMLGVFDMYQNGQCQSLL